ncbi:hypothetical protein RSAG8_03912, partial [Rhizoctonia solani AG-8 WAC10335]
MKLTNYYTSVDRSRLTLRPMHTVDELLRQSKYKLQQALPRIHSEYRSNTPLPKDKPEKREIKHQMEGIILCSLCPTCRAWRWLRVYSMLPRLCGLPTDKDTAGCPVV